MNRLATLLPLALSIRVALAGCAIPYTCDGDPLTAPPDGGVDPTLPSVCLGRCQPDRCRPRERYEPATCDCLDDPPDDTDADAQQPDASASP